MKASEFDESKFLNAKSAGKLNGTRLIIYDTKAEMVGKDKDQKRKMVVEFEGVEKTLIVNKTNREILTDAYGDDTDLWRAKSVVLNIVSVTFKGELTPSIQLTPAPIDRAQNNDNPLPDATAVLDDKAEPAEFMSIADAENALKIPGKKKR